MPRWSGCEGRISFRALPLDGGAHRGTEAAGGEVALAGGARTRQAVDPYAEARDDARAAHAYAEGRWRSPVVEPGFAFTELVPTWHARTPGGSWVEVGARVRTEDGWSPWLLLARWADHDGGMHPASVPGQQAGTASAATDTIHLDGAADAWQLELSLLAPVEGGEPGPVLRYAAAMASGPTVRALDAGPGLAAGTTLDVLALSQRVHAGNYPHWGGGGDTWCSPTSVAMVLAYWGVGPDRAALAWIGPDYPDPAVYHAVRHCWDHAYRGAGNWSFNAAYAARFGLRAFVTRLRDPSEAEAFVAAGIPLVASVRVDPAQLHGAEYTSAGHLLVIVGFTDSGDVIVNDPAALDRATVRRVYRRDQFDRAWAAGSGRIVYVLHPSSVALPRRSAEPNW